MTDTNDMRQDFEAWWKANINTEGMDLHRHIYPGGAGRWSYACYETHRSWMTWQAATERAIAVERERCAVVCQTMKTVSGTDDVKRGWNAALRGVAAAIRQNGAECQGAIYVTFDDSDTSRKRRAPLPSKPHKGVL